MIETIEEFKKYVLDKEYKDKDGLGIKFNPNKDDNSKGEAARILPLDHKSSFDIKYEVIKSGEDWILSLDSKKYEMVIIDFDGKAVKEFKLVIGEKEFNHFILIA